MNRKVTIKQIGKTKSHRLFLDCPTCETTIVLDKALFKKDNKTIFCNKCKSLFTTILTDSQKKTMIIKNISLHQIKEKFYEEIDEHDDGNRSDGPEGIEFTGESEEDLSSE